MAKIPWLLKDFTTMADYKIKIARDIIKDQFGALVEQICGKLMTKGRMTLDQLRKETQLTLDEIRQSLLVGIQHNFIFYTESIVKDIAVNHYSVNIDNVNIRIRFAKFILHAKERFGDRGELVAEELLAAGRISVPELEKAVMAREIEFRTALGAEIDEALEDHVRNLITQMIAEQYLVRVDVGPGVSKTNVAAAESADNTPAKARGRKRARKEDDDEEEDDKPVASAKRAPKKSKLSVRSTKVNEISHAPAPIDVFMAESAADTSNNTNIATAPQQIGAFHDTKVLWTLNYDRMTNELRKDFIVQLVQEKIDNVGATIIREMFHIIEPSLRQSTTPVTDTSNCVVSEEQLMARMMEHDKLKVSSERLRNYLDMMAKDKKTPILTKVLAPPGYTINATALIDILKQKSVESIVLHKFGAPSLRIWRLLLTKRLVEQKQISELAMIPVKDTRDRLYKMLSKDVVQLQEVPKLADHQPAKTFYLWSVRREQVNLLFVNEIYKAMHNMKLRQFHHLELSADVLNKAEEEEKLQAQGTNISVLSNQDRQALLRLKTIQDLLLNSLLQLDETLMIVKDF